MGKIVVRDVCKRFAAGIGQGSEVQALDHVSLEIADQEIVCLVGPSGCGKSTLLNILAGFDAPTHGEVRVGDVEVRDAGPDRIVVFQTPALFPWMTVRDNIAFGPRKRGVPARADRQRAGEPPGRAPDGRAVRGPRLPDAPRHAGAAAPDLGRVPSHDPLHHPRRGGGGFLADRLYVMTRRPGRVKEEIAVPFPKPRTFDIVTTPTFVSIKERVLHLIREELTTTRTRGSVPGRTRP